MNGRDRVGWNLRRVRTQQRITQENLAVDAEVDRTTISGIEKGTYNPTVDLLQRLADALAVDIATFFELAGANDPEPKPLPAGRKPSKARG
jgi:transcriptional regulator with XRE-family HTH domain